MNSYSHTSSRKNCSNMSLENTDYRDVTKECTLPYIVQTTEKYPEIQIHEIHNPTCTGDKKMTQMPQMTQMQMPQMPQMAQMSSCALDFPYPPIKVNCKNEYYAKVLLGDFAGNVSEMTAITQYIYHSLVLARRYDDISKTLECIAMVEMRHLDMIGNLICLLGVEPKYRIIENKKSVNWTPDYISYSNSLTKIILDNIDGEKKAIAKYKKSITMIGDENITAVLQRIIMDEELHIKILSNLYSNIVSC